jgi:type II secretory pathway pseudopilin PulG
VSTRVTVRTAHGFALIDMIFVCGVIGLLASIAMPSLFSAKQSAASASAMASLRAINSAQLTYALTCGAGFYAPSLSRLGTSPPGSNEGFIGGGLGTADTVTKSSYVFQLSASPFPGSPSSCNGAAPGEGGQGFKAAADPNVPPNARFFGTNANNVIFEHTSTLWAAMPEVGDPPVGHILNR